MRATTLRRRGSTPLAELHRLAAQANRTMLLRLGLGLALAGALVLTILSARSAGSGRAAVLPRGASTGVVVLDMSASINGPVFRRVATVLQGIAAANQAIGLVMFSDVAYELLPPDSPASALPEFLRFFRPVRTVLGSPIFGRTPWDQFSGGTNISAGLVAGAAALRRAHVAHGSLLLVSDLDDEASDLGPLIAEASTLRHAHIPVRIVPLFAYGPDLNTFTGLFGRNSLVDPKVFRHRVGQHTESVAAGTAWALIGLGGALVLLLALNELLNTRVELELA
ncbi:MAG TPA: vWA domain-containing protein [Gaiellaceae bacterium]|nr:vWA domain-containing protein [Gaiellaceae bacterium]